MSFSMQLSFPRWSFALNSIEYLLSPLYFGGNNMPYDFHKHKKYSFDFIATCQPLLRDEYFKDQVEYVNKWSHVFKTLEQLDDTRRTSVINELDKNEFYQFKINFDNQSFMLQFNVETIKNDVLKMPQYYTVQKISTVHFGISGSPAKILYTQEQKSTSIKNNPIIICPLNIGDAEFVVIDGNHRISEKIRNNDKVIEVVAYKPETQKCFMSLVDWAMYLFKSEVYQICIDHNHGKSLKHLIEQSHVFTTFKNI